MAHTEPDPEDRRLRALLRGRPAMRRPSAPSIRLGLGALGLGLVTLAGASNIWRPASAPQAVHAAPAPQERARATMENAKIPDSRANR